MKNISIWDKDTKHSVISDKNDKDHTKTDILIIGGGITGLTIAYYLKDSKYKVMIIDHDQVGKGVTKNTTAKISYLQETIYQDLEKNFNLKTSKLYFDSQMEASKIINSIIKKEKINCDIKNVDAYLFTNDEKNVTKINKERDILLGFDIQSEEVTSLPIKFPMIYGFKVKGTYVFHPLKYVDGILNSIEEKCTIKEKTIAVSVKKENKDKYYTYTNNGTIESKYVVIACHYPFYLLPNLIPVRNYMIREYVNAAPFRNYNFSAINIDKNLHSIRFYDDYIIYGSNKHRLTDKIDYEKHYQKSKSDFTNLFGIKPTYTWMNQDLIIGDKLPYIGRIHKDNPYLLVACGYQAWGMTNGTIAGKVISDLILDKDNPYTSLFSPQRKSLSLVKESLIDVFHYAKVYLQTFINKNPSFYKDNVFITNIKGKPYGVYVDENDNKHIVSNKCPHMRCNLVFNQEEKTWDCPCHGSRFTIDGDVLEGPSTYSIRYENK